MAPPSYNHINKCNHINQFKRHAILDSLSQFGLTAPWCVSQVHHTLMKRWGWHCFWHRKLHCDALGTWGKGMPQIWFNSQRQSDDAGNAFPGRLLMRQPLVVSPKKTKSLWFQCQLQGHTCYCFFNLVCLRLPDRAHYHCLLNHSMERQEFLREECLSRERKEKFKACEHIFLP